MTPLRPTRVVVVGDSLVLPRVYEDQVVRLEQTWPYLVERRWVMSQRPIEVVACGARARTADRLLGEEFTEHVIYKRPDWLVVQVGITDCSPRIFSKFEKQLLNVPGFPAGIRQRIIRYRAARRHLITKKDPLRRVYTRPDIYRDSLREFCTKLVKLDWPVRTVFLGILSHPERMEKKSPGHTGNVSMYNEILEGVAREFRANFCAPKELLAGGDPEVIFYRDGYHLTPIGNDLLAKNISTRLERDLGLGPSGDSPVQRIR